MKERFGVNGGTIAYQRRTAQGTYGLHLYLVIWNRVYPFLVSPFVIPFSHPLLLWVSCPPFRRPCLYPFLPSRPSLSSGIPSLGIPSEAFIKGYTYISAISLLL